MQLNKIKSKYLNQLTMIRYVLLTAKFESLEWLGSFVHSPNIIQWLKIGRSNYYLYILPIKNWYHSFQCYLAIEQFPVTVISWLWPLRNIHHFRSLESRLFYYQGFMTFVRCLWHYIFIINSRFIGGYYDFCIFGPLTNVKLDYSRKTFFIGKWKKKKIYESSGILIELC